MRREQVLLGAILAFITLVFVFVFFVPQTNRIAALKSQLRRARVDIKKVEDFARRLNRVEHRLETYATILSDLDRKLPPGADLKSFLVDVSRLLVDEQVQAGALEPQPTVRTNRLTRTPLRLTCTGTFGRLYRFLCRLEGLPRLCHVDKVIIKGEQTGRGRLQMDIHLRVFSLQRSGDEPSAGVPRQSENT